MCEELSDAWLSSTCAAKVFWLYKHCTTGSTSSEEHSAVLQGEFYFVCYMTKAMYLVIEHDVQQRKFHVYIKS